eukprot:g4020.t1
MTATAAPVAPPNTGSTASTLTSTSDDASGNNKKAYRNSRSLPLRLRIPSAEQHGGNTGSNFAGQPPGQTGSPPHQLGEIKREHSITMTPGGLKSATLWPWATRHTQRRASVTFNGPGPPAGRGSGVDGVAGLGPAAKGGGTLPNGGLLHPHINPGMSLSKMERCGDDQHALFTPFTQAEHGEHYKFQDRLVFAPALLVCQYLGSSLRSLYYQNLFHSILDFRMRTLFLIVAATYVLFWIVVALLFLAADENCGLHLGGNFIKAYLIALQTCVTIGYTFSTFRRAATVVFTDKAIIKMIDGEPHFVFQVAEIRKQSLLEAHIRCYCFKHCDVINPLTGQKSKSRVLQQFPMRLQSPDDELGGMLFLATPLLVVHRIDEWSPLHRVPGTLFPIDKSDVVGAAMHIRGDRGGSGGGGTNHMNLENSASGRSYEHVGTQDIILNLSARSLQAGSVGGSCGGRSSNNSVVVKRIEESGSSSCEEAGLALDGARGGFPRSNVVVPSSPQQAAAQAHAIMNRAGGGGNSSAASPASPQLESAGSGPVNTLLTTVPGQRPAQGRAQAAVVHLGANDNSLQVLDEQSSSAPGTPTALSSILPQESGQMLTLSSGLSSGPPMAHSLSGSANSGNGGGNVPPSSGFVEVLTKVRDIEEVQLLPRNASTASAVAEHRSLSQPYFFSQDPSSGLALTSAAAAAPPQQAASPAKNSASNLSRTDRLESQNRTDSHSKTSAGNYSAISTVTATVEYRPLYAAGDNHADYRRMVAAHYSQQAEGREKQNWDAHHHHEEAIGSSSLRKLEMDRQGSGIFKDNTETEKNGGRRNWQTQLSARRDYLCPPLRMVDAERGMFALFACPYCGESYVSKKLYHAHLKNSVGEGCHPDEVPDFLSDDDNGPRQSDEERLESYDVNKREPINLLTQDYFEVLVLVEGIEPFTSTTVQARHSYAFGQDIVVNGDFMPCTFLKQDGTAMVDFGKFHQVVKCEDKAGSGRKGRPAPAE